MSEKHSGGRKDLRKSLFQSPDQVRMMKSDQAFEGFIKFMFDAREGDVILRHPFSLVCEDWMKVSLWNNSERINSELN